MSARQLPNVYTSINDLSQLAEGTAGLSVAIVLQAKKGTIGAATIQSSPQDLLANYTYAGTIKPTDDMSFQTAVKILGATNQLYVSRAAKNALYGGLILKSNSEQPIPFSQEEIGAITAVTSPSTITLTGNLTAYFQVDETFGGDKVEVRDNLDVSFGIYTVASATFDGTNTEVVFVELLLGTVAIGQLVFRNSIANPVNYNFKAQDLAILTGIDQGSYNSNIEINIVSSSDSTAVTEANAFEIIVVDSVSNSTLETFVVGRDMSAIATNGTNLYIEDVVGAGSNFIRAINNIQIPSTVIPVSTTSEVQMSGGYDGDTLETADLVSALNVFADNILPISILANGSIENAEYQQAMIELASTRQDCFAFINSRLTDELAATNSTKASNIASYKTGSVSSTSFYAAMYAPHVVIPDVYNSRNITIGADAKVIPAWLNVINNQGYPYAAAGYQYGAIQGATCNWKIAPTSGEATTLNDASVNFIAFDPIQGSYLLWTQNTLQMANSAMRNIGVVLNVLDIKQNLAALLRQFLQLPITTSLRSQMVFTGSNYMNFVLASNRVSNFAFQDVSSKEDISNNTLRFICTISPTMYAQQIYLVINIVNNTFNFQILQNM